MVSLAGYIPTHYVTVHVTERSRMGTESSRKERMRKGSMKKDGKKKKNKKIEFIFDFSDKKNENGGDPSATLSGNAKKDRGKRLNKEIVITFGDIHE